MNSTTPVAPRNEAGPIAPPINEGAPIIVRNVSKWYGDVVAVSDVSFSVDSGVTALLGPNGAGKSTMLEMLTGLLHPSAGTIEILGKPVRGDDSLYADVGLVPEQEHIYPFMSGREFLMLNAVLQNLPDPEDAAQRALETVEMVDAGDRPLRGYSKGMRQRTKIAAAILHDPQVVLMDEPLTGTDPLQRARMMELIRKLGAEGRTVMISSHVLDEVERVADRILVIVNGKLAAAGDFRAIRDKIDEHARGVRIRAVNARKLAGALIQEHSTVAIRLEPDSNGGEPSIVAETADVRGFYTSVPVIAQRENVRLLEVSAVDDSLASVFAYVVGR